MQGYALRYYKTYDLNGHNVTLEIYKKYPAVEYAPTPMEIGKVLQGLTLNVQGEQDDIISPIVKTSLSITLADASGVEAGKKTGNWEEFYTPDSTGYKVLLYIDGAIYWSGYITPDSFEESLEYHGSVTIVARDNIGHLQDFQFDADGNDEAMISVKDIIDLAWAKVECQLELVYASGADVVWPTCEEYTALDCVVNTEAFAEKNWFEALEAVLDSFGLVLRYVGNNKAMIMPLRAIPCLDKERLSLVEVKDTLLQATAHRMLTAACKSIVDNVNYEQGTIAEFDFVSDDYQRVTLNVNGNSVNSWETKAKSGWKRIGNVGTINPFEFGSDPRSGANYASNTNLFVSVVNDVSPTDYIYTQRVFSTGEQTLDVSFTFNGVFYSANYGGTSINVGSAKEQEVSLNYAFKAYICDDQANVCAVKYFDPDTNTFVDEEKYCVASLSYGHSSSVGRYGQQSIKVEHSITIPANTGTFQFNIYGFTASLIEAGAVQRPSRTPIKDMINAGKAYCKISDFVMEQKEATSYRYSKLTSIYDESYNLMLTRNPALGVGPLVLSPKVIKNGIYIPDEYYSAARVWRWPNGENTSLQALIAQQILMYYSQPNSIITGTLVAEAIKAEILNFNCLWAWRGKTLVLVSGQLDLMSGFIEDAKLREYLDWEKLWPAEGYLLTEDGANYVISDDGSRILIGKIYYNLIAQNGDLIRTDDNSKILLNGKQ